MNQLVVYLLPLEGEEAGAGLKAELTVGTTSLPLAECGSTCRQTTATLDGKETVQRTDVLWPDLIRPQHEPVFCGQPLHRNHPPVPGDHPTATRPRAPVGSSIFLSETPTP